MGISTDNYYPQKLLLLTIGETRRPTCSRSRHLFIDGITGPAFIQPHRQMANGSGKYALQTNNTADGRIQMDAFPTTGR